MLLRSPVISFSVDCVRPSIMLLYTIINFFKLSLFLKIFKKTGFGILWMLKALYRHMSIKTIYVYEWLFYILFRLLTKITYDLRLPTNPFKSWRTYIYNFKEILCCWSLYRWKQTFSRCSHIKYTTQTYIFLPSFVRYVFLSTFVLMSDVPIYIWWTIFINKFNQKVFLFAVWRQKKKKKNFTHLFPAIAKKKVTARRTRNAHK